MNEVRQIKIDLIDPCDDSRVIDPAHVQAMVDDLKTGDTPGASPIDVIKRGKRYQQIFGQHRLASHIEAGKSEILCRIFEPEAFEHVADIKLHQVKENLFQRSLSALDKALAINDWKEAYEQKFPTFEHGGRRVKTDDEFQVVKMTTCFSQEPKSSSSQNENLKADRFSKSAAEAIGMGKDSIYRALKIAQCINLDFIDRISLHPIAKKQSELLALVEHEPDVQAEILKIILDEEQEAATVADAFALHNNTAAPTKIASWEKVSSSFSRMKQKEQFKFFDANAEAIERWLARRK